MLWFVHVFDDFVKRHKLIKNFSPEDILHCVDGLSETEREEPKRRKKNRGTLPARDGQRRAKKKKRGKKKEKKSRLSVVIS